VLVASVLAGCLNRDRRSLETRDNRVYPPAPQTPRVVALGSLRTAAPPTPAQVQLALFLFGAEPPPPLSVVSPSGMTATPEGVLICDAARGTLWRWDEASGRLHEATRGARWEQPFEVAVGPDGALLVCDRRGIWRWDGSGPARRAVVAEAALRPGGILVLDDEIWVSDQSAHRIEVYDYATGELRRRLGQAGSGPGQFAFPRGLALLPDGHVCVVDLLNNRLQVIDREGHFVRQIGQSGDVVGTFGRPRAVAVGPDGTIFVTDAFHQRVQVFSSAGEPLLAFGDPGSGPGALLLPGGIAVTSQRPPTEMTQPLDTPPAYYVLVAEQIADPGIRVYAWLGTSSEVPSPSPVETGGQWHAKFPQSAAMNPHWHPQRCARCHESGPGQRPEPARVDGLCLSCHDGLQAPADPHPIGRQAVSDIAQTPADWPTAGGVIGCLTCHDIKRHCDPSARRPAVNPMLLRGYDPQRPLAYCATCHPSEEASRFSPHRQLDRAGKVREEACLFCHVRRPELPADGRRRFDPQLRTATSALCTNCHAPHWDLSPRGHVDRPVPEAIYQWMRLREIARHSAVSPDEAVQLARLSDRPPARLPLGDGRVTCYTCHNPHHDGLFPADSELGSLASNPLDRAGALRTDWIELCSECHWH